MLILNFKTAASLALAFSLTGCVATRKHVRNVSDPLDRRIGGLEAKNRDVEGKLEIHEKGIMAADERAKGADQRAADAAKEAKIANEKVAQVGEQTTAAAKTAGEAKTTAEQGLSKASAVDARLTSSLASIDKFQLLTSQSVLFGISRSSLTPEANKALDEAAVEALKHSRYVIEVQGFTDTTGAADANLALSRQRADEVVRYLTMQHKIPLYRIYQLGAGESLPVADDKTREGRKQNRRVEVKVYSADAEGSAGKVTTTASAGSR